MPYYAKNGQVIEVGDPSINTASTDFVYNIDNDAIKMNLGASI